MKTPEHFIEEIWQHAPNGMNKRKLADKIREREKEQAVEFTGWMWENNYDFESYNGKEMIDLYDQLNHENV